MAFLLPSIYAFGASLAFAIVFNIRKDKLLLSALGGAIGQLTFILFQLVIPNDITLYLLSTIAISLYAEILARVTKSPTTIYLIVALIPLVPGGGVYYTMLHFIKGEIDLGIITGLHTLGISGALAMGIVITSSSVTLLRKIIITTQKKKKKVEVKQ
jgi:uncharacterized membrane protein YjjB (DUF3815 family)